MRTDFTIPPILRDADSRAQMSTEEKDLHEACWNDLGVHCKTWLPGRFNMPYTSLHKQVIDVFNQVRKEQLAALSAGTRPGRRICIIGCRGTAKTSFSIHGECSRRILYGPLDNRTNFIVPITKTEGNCIIQTENLRRLLRTDRKVRRRFGDIKTNTVNFAVDDTYARDTTYIEEAFGKTGWAAATAFGRSYVMPRGVGQQVRGLVYGDDRPNYFPVDDFDDDKWLQNDQLRDWYHEDWFHGVVKHAVSQYEAEMVPWLIVVTDSSKHDSCLVEKLAQDPSWETVRIRAATPDLTKTLCSEFLSQEALVEEVNYAKRHGTLDVLSRELASEPTASQNRPFPNDVFKYYDPAIEEPFGKQGQWSFVMMDPARTENPMNSDTAIVAATVDLNRDLVFYTHVLSAPMHPDVMVEELLNMALLTGAFAVGVEYAGLHLHISADIESAMARRGMYDTILSELKPQQGAEEQSGYGRSKNARIIWGLKSWFSWGIVYLHPDRCTGLQTQLSRVPRGGKKDIADAAAYLRQLMQNTGITFSPEPTAAAHTAALKEHRKRELGLLHYTSIAEAAASFPPMPKFLTNTLDGRYG